ncbi:hypothetical protein, partial [Methylobacterium trifolii]|uniref:hypothetical protein n=1 Tax=Methylobacterium trifolii TaxID=1003092 RepID=UPI001EDCEA56
MRGAWAVLLPALVLAPAARASYDGGPGYPLSLPQTLRGTVAVPLEAEPAGPADTLAALYPVLAACWRTPAGLDRTAQATARFALRRDGSLIGPPRITFGTGAAGRLRASLFRAAREA